MELIEVEKAQMEALRSLSDTNIKVSEAKTRLATLKEEEETYLGEREKKVVETIKTALDESETLVKETISNYEAVKKYHDEVKSLAEIALDVAKMVEGNRRSQVQRVAVWEVASNSQLESLGKQKEMIELGNKLLNSDREGIERQKKLLLDEKKRLNDERATLERAIKRLEEGRI